MNVVRPRVIRFGVFDFNLNAEKCLRTEARSAAGSSCASWMFMSPAIHRDGYRGTCEGVQYSDHFQRELRGTLNSDQ